MILAFLALSGPVVSESAGQASMSPRVLSPGGSGVVAVGNDPRLDPDSPESRAYAELRRRAREVERELRLIQREHFGRVRLVERREQGLRRLRTHTEPAAVLLMTELFDREEADVRGAILDHFATLGNEHGDAALAWEAVHGRDGWYRRRAGEHLAERAGALGETPGLARRVIAEALSGDDDHAAVAAGELVGTLRLFEFIPMMAAAQVATRGGGEDRSGDLGWIMIGNQTSFVADLVPVVSNAAVGLDPQIGVVSDGVMLRVHDAVVTVYRTEIHRTLVAMTSDAWGRPTGAMGFDAGAWREWYDREFVPFLATRD